MNITFTFKNFEASDQIKEYARSRFEKLSKYVYNEDTTEIQINFAVEKHRHMAEVVFFEDNIHLSAYAESADMYATVDLVLDKIEAQVKKVNDRLKEKKRRQQRDRAREKEVRMDVFTYSPVDDAGARERNIVTTDSYVPKPMDVDEAAMQLDTLDYDFLVFRNAETERINVIYRRKNNDFGLIDPGT